MGVDRLPGGCRAVCKGGMYARPCSLPTRLSFEKLKTKPCDGIFAGGRGQPFYHVLPDQADRSGPTYVAQENIELEALPELLTQGDAGAGGGRASCRMTPARAACPPAPHGAHSSRPWPVACMAPSAVPGAGASMDAAAIILDQHVLVTAPRT